MTNPDPIEKLVEDAGDVQAHPGEQPLQTTKVGPKGKIERTLHPPTINPALGVNAQLLGEGG